jgi:hypothetical protein
MLQISRYNALQIFWDYLNYRYARVEIESMSLLPSEVVVRCSTERSIDGMLDRFLYQEETAGRVMLSQDGLTIGITEEGRRVYNKVSPYYIKEYSHV